MEERFREPVLFDGEIEDDLNLDKPPATGEEYIKRVIVEARNCDEVAFAKIDETRLKKPTLNVKPLPECTKAPEHAVPTQEWQNCQISDFSNIRMHIQQIREEITNSDTPKHFEKMKLPAANHQEKWMDICTSINDKDSFVEPTLTVILSMNQPTIEQVLEYLVEYAEEQKCIEAHIGRWLYALLTALELPLNPDVCSCLRSLARVCSTIRCQIHSTDVKDVTSLNLLICLVARYFRQLDLADQ